jgi:hypothetical protein
LGRRPFLVPATTGTTSVALPENGNGDMQNEIEITELDKEE